MPAALHTIAKLSYFTAEVIVPAVAVDDRVCILQMKTALFVHILLICMDCNDLRKKQVM